MLSPVMRLLRLFSPVMSIMPTIALKIPIAVV
jgi:hypothetical protein